MNTVLGDIPEVIKKEKCFQNSMVFSDHISFRTPYSPDMGLAALHEHQFIEISYVESGSGFHRIWNEAYPVSEGNLYILNIAVPHGFFSASDAEPLTVHSLYFDPQDLFDGEITEIGGERYLFGLFAQNNFAVHLLLKPKQIKMIEQAFHTIRQETKNLLPDWRDMVISHLTLLLLEIKRLSSQSKAHQLYHETEYTPLTAAVLRLIRENYADPAFSLKNVSETLHKSTSSISRSFRDITGKCFSDYLCFYRMQQASALVLETELSNDEIALMCGYCDLPSFYRQFRQVIGMPPGEYRKLNKANVLSASLPQRNQKGTGHVLYTELSENLELCKRKKVLELVAQALEEGLAPNEILQEGLVRGMHNIGIKFHDNKIYTPEVYVAANIMHDCMDILKIHLKKAGVKAIGRAVICTVKGDMHDIGKNLVKLMLETEGIECIDLGIDVSPSAVVEAVKKHNVQLVCLSALLTTTMIVQKEIIDALKAAGLREHVRVMVGGAPITQEFADRIGADCYTSDSVAAAREAKRLIQEMKNS